MIKIQQLRSGLEEERKRQENVLVKNQEKTKQEIADMKDNYERKYNELNVKVCVLTFTKRLITITQLYHLSSNIKNSYGEEKRACRGGLSIRLVTKEFSTDI